MEHNDLDEKMRRRGRFIINVLFWGIIAAFVYIGLKVTEPVLAPLIIAFIIAWVLSKPIKFISGKTKIKKPVVALFIVLLFYGIIGILITQAGIKIFAELKIFFTSFPAVYEKQLSPVLDKVFTWLEATGEKLDPATFQILGDNSGKLLDTLAGMASSISSAAVSAISGMASSIPGFFMKTLITLIVTVFITIDYHNIVEFASRQIPDNARKVLNEIKAYTGTTLIACLKSYAIIMLITFSELFIGFSILGINKAIILAAIIAVIDILPILGTGGVLIPWSVYLVLSGNYTLAAGMIILYLIILVVRQVIEPKIVGSQVGLHPVLTLASMFVGLHFFGILGMFGFPITLSFIKNLNDRGVIHIFK